MASRAVGWGANPNLETSVASLVGNGRTPEALARVKPWTELDLGAYNMRVAHDFKFILPKKVLDVSVQSARIGSS